MTRHAISPDQRRRERRMLTITALAVLAFSIAVAAVLLALQQGA